MSRMALMLTNLKVIGKFAGALIISEAFTLGNVFSKKMPATTEVLLGKLLNVELLND